MQEDPGDPHPQGRRDPAHAPASRGSWQTPRGLAANLVEPERLYHDACRARDDAVRRSESLAKYLQLAREELVAAHAQLHERDASFRELAAVMLDKIRVLEEGTPPGGASSTRLANAGAPATLGSRVAGQARRLRESFKRIGTPRSGILGPRDGS